MLVISRLGYFGVYQKAVYSYCCVFNVSIVKFTELILWYMNLMNNGQMDRGNENPTQHLPWWLRKITKNLSQVGRHRDLNPGPPECESRALRRSHLARSYLVLFVHFCRKTRLMNWALCYVCMYVCTYVCMYIWGFRARQHLRSLTPVITSWFLQSQSVS